MTEYAVQLESAMLIAELAIVLFEDQPDAVIVVDDQGVIRLVNKSAELMFGYRRTELIGQPVETLVPEDLRDLHIEHRAGFLRAPQPRVMGAGRDVHGRHKTGLLLELDVTLNPVMTAKGAFTIAAARRRSER